MAKSNLELPDFTEDFVSFMVQMMLTITRFPRAPLALIPLSKKRERILGADVKIEAIAPLYIQFKRSLAYPEYSTAKYLMDRTQLGLSNNPRTLFFDLRKKDKDHFDFQHNILFRLGQRLQSRRIGTAIYSAPLFLNRSAYLVAVHISSMLNWRPWRLFYDHPFFGHEINLISRSGSIRFQNCPVLKEHITIPPHQKVSTHKHRYSYLESGKDICFHSPSVVEPSGNLGQHIYDYLQFRNGEPTTNLLYINESLYFLDELEHECFAQVEVHSDRLSILDRWEAFGERLKKVYDIEQYVVIKYDYG